MIAYFVVLCASVLHCLADAVHRNNDVNLQQWLPDLAELEGLSRTCQADTPNSQDKKTPSSRDAALDAIRAKQGSNALWGLQAAPWQCQRL